MQGYLGSTSLFYKLLCCLVSATVKQSTTANDQSMMEHLKKVRAN